MAMAGVVGIGCMDVVAHCVLIGALCRRHPFTRGINVSMREVSEELLHAEARQRLVPEKVIRHFAQLVLLVRVASGLQKVIVAALDAVFVRDDKVRVQVADVLRAADYVEAEQTLASHTGSDVPGLKETPHTICFPPPQESWSPGNTTARASHNICTRTTDIDRRHEGSRRALHSQFLG